MLGLTSIQFLSLVAFLPALGGLVLCLPVFRSDTAVKGFSLAVTIVTFLLTAALYASGFDSSEAAMQHFFSQSWIPTFTIYYAMGIDGISLPLVLLTSFLSVLAMGASWNITKNVKAYCILYLLLETGMLGVFLALDFFLFYIFWEVMLLPMYFLIGVWGGPRREYAAIKFFLYTLLGSVFMLIAILLLFFNSDVRELTPAQLVSTGVATDLSHAAVIKADSNPTHTFNILALQQLGQHTQQFSGDLLWGKNLQWWAFILLFVGFAIKVPSVPVHTWLPDAHVEAPTPISMILAGVLLKMGGYGIIRICYPICPQAGYDLAWVICFIGVLSMVYGGFAALAQKDFKRLVAYSSVSHMGYVVLGLGIWSFGTVGLADTGGYWEQGINGAMFQMIAHGISSAGMFFMVGVVYDRVHHRNLDEFGGLFARMPNYAGMAIVLFFAGLGLPGLCGFIGEVFVTLAAWNFSHTLAIISAGVVIITASYILWAIQRVYLGAEYRGPHEEHLHDMDLRETLIAWPLVILAVLFGVYPRVVLDPMQPSIQKMVTDLRGWTAAHEGVETGPAIAAPQAPAEERVAAAE